jgi:hypothetical protein
MSTASVFLDNEKAFHTIWHPSLLYKPSKLQLSISLIKLIASFLTKRIFKILLEGELLSPRKLAAGVPQDFVLAPVLYSLYINYAPRHLESTLLCSRIILVYTQQRYMSVAY